MSKTLECSLRLREQYLYSLIASFGCVCAGTVLGWTSPVLPQLNITESEGGILGSIVAIGAMSSALPAGYLSAKIGSKAMLKYLAAPFLLGWIILGFGHDLRAMYFARFLGGIASGGVCVCVPLYVADIASVSVRGILGSFFQISFCAGILLVNVLGALITWRDLSMSLALLPVIYCTALVFISDARRGEILEPEETEGLIHMLRSGKNARALKVALGLVFFQQLSGINAVIFYTAGIFSSAGSTFPPIVCAVIVAAVQMLFSCISASLIEKLNRRVYLSLSSSGMAVSLLLLGAYFHTKLLEVTLPSYTPLLSLVLFIVSFCVGFGPIPWLMMGELFAPKCKGLGCGVATMFNWSLIFVVTYTFPVVCARLGQHTTFYLLSGFNLLACVFTVFCVPETRGKTITQIQNSL